MEIRGARRNHFAQVIDHYKTNFIPGADANNLILQMHTWEQHDVGATPGFGGDVQQGAGIYQGAGSLHAVGDGPVFPRQLPGMKRRSFLTAPWDPFHRSGAPNRRCDECPTEYFSTNISQPF
jgi:hypothetical protein